METRLWQGKARQGKASFCSIYSFVKQKLKINDGRHPVWSFAPAQDLIQNNEILCSRCTPHRMTAAFTLVELSIVLVIIGLIIGGILVGQDLINAANVRAQISQIEKYNTAVHTFQTKYGYLPGDIPDPTAQAFGFKARGTAIGQGDGNGFLEGVNGSHSGGFITSGEDTMFWVDLSTANLIDGGFNTAVSTGFPALTSSDIPNYLPAAKIGGGNYVSVGSGIMCGWGGTPSYSQTPLTGYNYFNITAIKGTSMPTNDYSDIGLTVQQAYAIDSKIDDGLPQSGIVMAQYYHECSGICQTIYWAGNHSYNIPAPYNTATPISSTSCFDNGNVGGATQQYSTKTNSSRVNCAMMIQFQ